MRLTAVNVTLEDIAIEGNNNAAAYGGIMLLQDAANDNNTACFWTTIKGCSMRKRAGADTGTIPAAIILEGSQNATVIEDCSIGGSGLGIVFRPPSGQSFMPNGVLIQGNAFEGFLVEFDAHRPAFKTNGFTFHRADAYGVHTHTVVCRDLGRIE